MASVVVVLDLPAWQSFISSAFMPVGTYGTVKGMLPRDIVVPRAQR